MSSQSPPEPGDTLRWRQADPVYSQLPNIDPRIEWALGPGRDHFFRPGRQDRWMPVLVELKDMTVREFARGERFFDDARSLAWWQESIRISPLYLEPEDDEDSKDETHFTAMVRQTFFEFLKRNEPLNNAVASITLGLPLDEESLGFPTSANSERNSR